MLKLEVGKKYRARNGDIVFIASMDDDIPSFPFKSEENVWYERNGRSLNWFGNQSDLIEEIEAP
jgi:hypothetical protein